VFSAFADPLLAFDAAAAAHYATLVDTRERRGRPIEGFRAQIAAICRAHGATLATRNVKDFHATGVDIVDRWSSGCLTPAGMPQAVMPVRAHDRVRPTRALE
jgi:toxin FitB